MIKFKTPPVSVEQLKFAIEVANRAADRNIPVDPSRRGVTIVDDDTGEEERITFTDIPSNRAMLAVRDAFAKESGESDTELFMALMFRIDAMADAATWPMSEPHLDLAESGEILGCSDAFLRAAASCELSSRRMRFDKFKFSRALKQSQ